MTAACDEYEESDALHPCASEEIIRTVHRYGFQNDSFPPSMWADVDAVMGHPVPLFVWDILEAFPNAKIILTVRQADALWDTLSVASPLYWAKLADLSFNYFLKRMLWGTSWCLHYRRIPKFWAH